MKSSATSCCTVLAVSLAILVNSTSADEHVLSSTLANFDGQPWASIVPLASGYQLRLLTTDEKVVVDKTIKQYRERRGKRGASTSTDAKVVEAYRKLPSDLRSARFYHAGLGQSNSIVLKDDDVHAILPMSSISLVLMGPQGNLSATQSSSSSSSMLQALRGGDGMLSGGGSTMSGLLGGGSRHSNAIDENEPPELTLFYLKHAEAARVLEIVQEIHGGDRSMRATIDQRTNAIVIHAQPTTIEKVTQLLEALDREVKPTAAKGERPRLETYDIGGADSEAVYSVLQTLFAGTPDIRMAVDQKTGKIIVFARPTEHAKVKSVLEKF